MSSSSIKDTKKINPLFNTDFGGIGNNPDNALFDMLSQSSTNNNTHHLKSKCGCASCRAMEASNNNANMALASAGPGSNIDPNRVQQLATAIKSNNIEELTKFDYLRSSFEKNSPQKLQQLDDITKQILEDPNFEIKHAGGDFKLDNDTDVKGLVQNMENGSKPIPEGIRWLVASGIARNFINNPQALDTFKKTNVTFFVAKNDNKDGTIGLYLSPEELEAKKHVVTVDENALLEQFVQKPDLQGGQGQNIGVGFHEFQHLLDGLDGKVDGFQIGWSQAKKDQWKGIVNNLVLKRYNNPEAFPRNFGYALSSNNREALAGLDELFNVDSISLKKFAPEAYAFIAADKGYDPAQATLQTANA